MIKISEMSEQMILSLILSISLITIILCQWFIDKPLAMACHEHSNALITLCMQFLSEFGKGFWVISTIVLLWSAAYWRRKTKLMPHLEILFITVIVSGLLCIFSKIILGRARPVLWFEQNIYGFYGPQFTAKYWSFPSGHSTTISAVMMMALRLWPSTKRFAITAIVLVAGSRVVLTQHYLSDVIAGALLGAVTVERIAQQLKNSRYSRHRQLFCQKTF